MPSPKMSIAEHTERCEVCKALFMPNADEAERPAPENPGRCVACHHGATDPLRFHDFSGGARTNESHNPADWTHNA